MTRNWRILVIGAFVIVVVGLPAAVTFYTDWLWFGETGYQDVFVRKLTAQGALGAAAAGRGLRRPVAQPPDRDADDLAAGARAQHPRGPDLRSPSIATACSRWARRSRRCWRCSSASFASAQWQDWLLFRHGQPFGETDPVLGKDVGFFVFRLPFLEALRGYLLALVALAGVLAGAVYVLAGAIDLDLSRGARIARPARRHLAALAAALLAGAGVRRVSRRAAAADDAGRHHPWRRERRCGRPDSGAAGADGRRTRRRRRWRSIRWSSRRGGRSSAPPRCTSS